MTFNKLFIKSLKQQLILASIIFSPFVQAEDISLDSIAAVVNNDIIMLSEIRKAAARVKPSSDTPSTQTVLYKEVLEKLILDKIQVQRAKAIGIKIDDVAVNEAMQSIADQNKLDLQQFRVALINEGLNYKEFRENLRDRLYTDTLRKRQQGRNKKISENEVDDLIQAESFALSKDVQYHLIDILVPNTNGQSVKQFNSNLSRAQQLRKKILTKSDLSPIALQKMGANSKDLGWQSSNSLNPAYVRTLSLMNEGELSEIVRDDKGFHILKLVEQRGGKRKQTQQARVRHILIPKDAAQSKLKATQLRNKILAGGNFTKLAQEFSADKGSAIKGGELPMANPATYVPPFASAVKILPLNTLSQPIQTRFGWHIIEVLERRKSDQTRAAIKVQAQSLISEKKQTDEFNNWLQGLRDQAFVEYRIKL